MASFLRHMVWPGIKPPPVAPPPTDVLSPLSPTFNPEAFLRDIPRRSRDSTLNHREADGRTTLAAVCALSRERLSPVDRDALVRALLDAGADPLAGQAHRTPSLLEEAAGLGHVGMVKAALARVLGGSRLHAQPQEDDDGWDPDLGPFWPHLRQQQNHALNVALERGEVGLAEQMLDRCVPTEARGPWLWWGAVKGGHAASLELLKRRGVPWGIGTETGLVLWSWAPDVPALICLRQALPDLPINVQDDLGMVEGHHSARGLAGPTGGAQLERLMWWLEQGGNPRMESRNTGNVLMAALKGLTEERGSSCPPVPGPVWTAIGILREQGCTVVSPAYEKGMDKLMDVLDFVAPEDQMPLLDAVMSFREWVSATHHEVVPLTVLNRCFPSKAGALRDRWCAQQEAAQLALALPPAALPPSVDRARRPRM